MFSASGHPRRINSFRQISDAETAGNCGIVYGSIYETHELLHRAPASAVPSRFDHLTDVVGMTGHRDRTRGRAGGV